MFISTKMLTISAVVVFLVATVAVTVLPSPSLISQQAFGQSNATQETPNQTGGNMTTTSGGGGGDQETANKQLDQAVKALDSGDNAAAEGYLKEADNSLSEGEAKMHIGEAMKSLQAGDIDGAKMHSQLAQGLL
jgi:cellobiose-specific phosphotransferase system component IIA